MRLVRSFAPFHWLYRLQIMCDSASSVKIDGPWRPQNLLHMMPSINRRGWHESHLNLAGLMYYGMQAFEQLKTEHIGQHLLTWFKREGFRSTNSNQFQNQLSTWTLPQQYRDLCVEVWCFGGQCERGSPVEEFEYALWNFMSCIWWELGGGGESTLVDYLQTLARISGGF